MNDKSTDTGLNRLLDNMSKFIDAQLPQDDKFAEFLRYMVGYLREEADGTNLDVFPVQCGAGKSRFVTCLIYALLRWSDCGALIVTDNVERMKSYVSPEGQDGEIRAYIQAHMNRVLVLESSNARERAQEVYQKQIVCMTTQRYFNLTREELSRIVGSGRRRRFIVFDERIPLSERVRIDIKLLNEVDTALQQRLDNALRQNKKRFLVDAWKVVRARFEQLFSDAEHAHKGKKWKEWHVFPDKFATPDDAGFLRLVCETYRDKLEAGDKRKPSIHRMVMAVLQAVHEGGLLISRKKLRAKSKAEYDNCMLVEISNMELVTGLEYEKGKFCKVFALDATGGIDPTYDKPCVSKRDVSEFDRPLDRLKLRFMNVNTSKTRMTGNRPEDEQLRELLHGLTITSGEVPDAVFTYLKTEKAWKDDSPYKSGHFGALKGSNDFRECRNIWQLGLNRYREDDYLCGALHNEMWKLGSEEFEPQTLDYDALMLKYGAAMEEYMLASLMADVIQNVWRGCIRNADNGEEMVYTLVYSCNSLKNKDGEEKNELSALTEGLRAYFEERGASVEMMDTPDALALFKIMGRETADGKPTCAQRIAGWIKDQPHGRIFKRKELLEECGIYREQFDSARSENKQLDNLFKSMLTERKGYYKIP